MDFDIFDLLSEPVQECEPWDSSRDVLTTRSFPSTVTYREQWSSRTPKSTCKCSDAEKHRNFFDFCKVVAKPCLEKGEDIPDIKVCWNARSIFEMEIPRELYTGPKGNRCSIYDLPTVGDVEYVLRKGTYWYGRAAHNGSVRNEMTDLGRQLLILLAGRNSNEGLFLNAGALRKCKTSEKGISRLKNVLATIDGIMMQICLCYPGSSLDWPESDTIIHCLLRNLVPDYIRPGNRVNTESSYEKIKRIRKSIKEGGFHVTKNVNDIEVPSELSFYRRMLKPIADGKKPIDMYRVSVLCQTRASGVPPRTVYERTFAEIKEVLRTPPDDAVYKTARPHIKKCVDDLHIRWCAGKSDDKLASQFGHINKMAKVSLSDSAELFSSTNDGGKLESAREVLSQNPEIAEINLDNGQPTGKLLTDTNSSFGERLFHWGLSHFNLREPKKTYDSNVMSVKISLVAEMGKYRGITVSHLAHALVLHVFSHLGLEYLRFIPSSASGVGAANHAWNFFKRMTKANPAGAFVLGDEDSYLFSTDWKTATDFMEHRVTAEILNHFCRKLGLPEWYRQVVVCALTQPRQIEFMDEDRILDRFYTGRGVLMGDPGTKVVLHLYHLLCRDAAKYSIALQQ